MRIEEGINWNAMTRIKQDAIYRWSVKLLLALKAGDLRKLYATSIEWKQIAMFLFF